MSYRLHIKIIEAINIQNHNGSDIYPFVTISLKSNPNGFFQTHVISETSHPIWNNEFDIPYIDPKDVLLINMYNETDTTNEKIMDELQYTIDRWSIEGISERKEVNITYEMKNAGKLIFEVQNFEIRDNEKYLYSPNI